MATYLFRQGSEIMSTKTVVKQAYELDHNPVHIEDTSREYDAYIVEWPEYREYGLKFCHSKGFDYPAHGVEFQGYESSLSDTDYPYENVGWPIMSKRMLNTLLSVKEFPHRTWDVPFVGFPDNAPEELLRKGLRDGVRHDNEFVVVQLLEQLDIFDRENSVYKDSDILPGAVNSIRKLALHVSKDGLPPVFRLKVSPVQLYISPECRDALEAANIRGIRFV
jgi:hypothetical protein